MMDNKLITQISQYYFNAILSIVKLYVHDKQAAEDVTDVAFRKIAKYQQTCGPEEEMQFIWMGS